MAVGLDLSFPLARDEVLATRDSLIPALVKVARDSRNPGSPAGIAVGASLVYLVTEVLSAYQACALARRLGDEAIVPAASRDWRLLAGALSGERPAAAPLQRVLAAGPTLGSTRLPLGVRRLRWELAWNGLTGLLGPTASVDVLESTPLLDWHGRHASDKLRYSPLEHWLVGITAPRSAPPRVVSDGTRASLLEVIRGAFAAGGEQLPVSFAEYLEDWIGDVCAALAWYVEQLTRAPRALPRHLWTSAGSPIWTRVLRHATRLASGRVTGHDHALGLTHVRNHYRELVELESCDVFMTFTEAGAQSLKDVLQPDLLLEDQPPEIVAAPGGDRRLIVKNAGSHRRGTPSRRSPVRRIMYVATRFVEETVHMVPLMPGAVQANWTARLLEKLGTWGYEIVYKPHPEGPPPPRELLSLPRVRLENRRFEQVVYLADVLLMDFPLSATLGPAVASGMPLVLIDFGFADWTPRSLAAMQGRVRMVPGSFSEQNLAQVEWDQLHDAIEGCGELMDSTFCETWLRYGD